MHTSNATPMTVSEKELKNTVSNRDASTLDSSYKKISFALDKAYARSSRKDTKHDVQSVIVGAFDFLDLALNKKDFFRARVVLDKVSLISHDASKVMKYKKVLNGRSARFPQNTVGLSVDYDAYSLAMIKPSEYRKSMIARSEKKKETKNKTVKKSKNKKPTPAIKAVVKHQPKTKIKEKTDIVKVKPATLNIAKKDDVLLEERIDSPSRYKDVERLPTFNDIDDEPLASINLDLNIIATRSSEAELYIEPICKAIIDNNSSIIIRSKTTKDYRWLMVELKRCVWRLDKKFKFRIAHRRTNSENIVVDFHPYRDKAYFIKPS